MVTLLASLVLLASTTLHFYSPWAGSIPAQGVTVDQTVRGSCSHGSEVLTRFDAWHCTAGGRAYDPCFANDRVEVGAHVLCMSSPWEDATSIELTKRLPLDLANPSGNPERFPPWAIVTAANERCPLVRASLGTVGGQRITNACAGSAVLLGLPTRGRTWTQAYAPSTRGKTVTRVALRTIYW